MRIKIAAVDLKTFSEIECGAAKSVGAFIVHPEFRGLDDNGTPRFGSRWTVSLPSGVALGAGAYKGPRAATAAAKAMQSAVVNPDGLRLADVFGCAPRLVYDVAKRHMDLDVQ